MYRFHRQNINLIFNKFWRRFQSIFRQNIQLQRSHYERAFNILSLLFMMGQELGSYLCNCFLKYDYEKIDILEVFFRIVILSRYS